GEAIFNFEEAYEINDGFQIYYSYTADKDIRIEIDLCDINISAQIGLAMWNSDCTDPVDARDYGGSIEECGDGTKGFFTLNKGETLYFNVTTLGDVDGISEFTFSIKEIVPQEGELCTLPILVVADTTYRTPEDMDEIYYSYTPTQSGVVTVSQATPTYVVSAGVMATSEQCDKSAEIFG